MTNICLDLFIVITLRANEIFMELLLSQAYTMAGLILFSALFNNNSGMWMPGSYFQRYRGAEFSKKKPFFQWWYFSLKDYANNLTFAFCYSLNRPVKIRDYQGAYIIFAIVNSQTKGHTYHRFPLSSFKAKNHHDIDIGEQLFTVSVINDDHYRIKGTINAKDSLWACEGIDPSTFIHWDLNIFRISGWYGQKDFEAMQRIAGIISWNPYAYNAEVEGTVTINKQKFLFQRNEHSRIYCDTNWGESLPGGGGAKKGRIDYHWGWYYTGKPRPDPRDDFSIIAGTGRSQPARGFKYDLMASLASVYNRGSHVDARYGRVFNWQPEKGILFLSGSSEGSCKHFSVDHSSWTEFSDLFGTAMIPLVQTVTIKTSLQQIIMTFVSKKKHYNRLLTPADGYIFSNFEALGVLCTTEIYEKQGGSYILVDTIVDYNGGLEFGYRVDPDFSGLSLKNPQQIRELTS